MKINLVSLFSGYDSQALSMERLKRDYPDKFDYELVAWCEIDKAACMAHDALFPQWKDRNLGDISKVKAEDIPDCDCMTWSFPCTDISGAGKQMGLSKNSGTRSSLAWEAIRCFKEKRPKYLLMENVAALAQRRFIKDFHALQHELEQMGYTNFCAILDSAKFGVPQHRERLFMISILDCDQSYHFPEPFKLEKRIKDILEPYGTVDESFYFSAKQLASMFKYCAKKKDEGCGFQTQFTDENGIASCDTTRYGASYTDAYLKEPALQQRLSLYGSNAQAGRVYDVEGIAPTVKCQTGGNSEPKILTPVRTEEAKELRRKGIEVFKHRELVPREDGICNTITTVTKDYLLQEPCILGYTRDDNGKVCDRHDKEIANVVHSSTGSGGNTDQFVKEPVSVGISVHPLSHKLEFDGMKSVKEISPTLRATDYKCPHCLWEKHDVRLEDLPDKTVLKDEDGKGYLWQDGSLWRIRKLTPLEVGRLMDCSDEDIQKMIDAGISKSKLYSCFGNSIVVGVLEKIFSKLWIDTENESAQKSLFDFKKFG